MRCMWCSRRAPRTLLRLLIISTVVCVVEFRSKVANSTLLVKTVLEKQFCNQNQLFQFLVKRTLLESGKVDYGLRCKQQLDQISKSVDALEGTLKYIKNNAKVFVITF